MPKTEREEFETSDSETSPFSPELEPELKHEPIHKRQRTAAPFNFSIDYLMQSAAGNHKLANGGGGGASTATSVSPSSGLALGLESGAGGTSLTGNSNSASLHQSSHSATTPNGTSQQPGGPNGGSRISQVECILDNKEMWDKFHSLNTEMIITKTGRRMFPVLKVQFLNLDPNARYSVSMDIVPVDNKRYRYAYHKSCWQQAGKADPSAETRLYPHPDAPFNGDLLSRQVISFEKVKLTNNEMDKSGHIILNSMHKYQPRVHLVELKSTNTTSTSTTGNSKSSHSSSSSSSSSGSTNNNIDNHYQSNRSHHSNNNNHHHQHHHNQSQQAQQSQLEIEGYKTFTFPETVFTAVTAYQNQLITKMKIDKNPFAKGFRDSSRLSDFDRLDRNDPFDYVCPLGSGARQVVAPGTTSNDPYQLLSSAAANNPWYSAAMVAAAAGNPGACSNSLAQFQATQMWLAAFSACLNGQPGAPGAGPSGEGPRTPPAS